MKSRIRKATAERKPS